jgi:hypothetical protein
MIRGQGHNSPFEFGVRVAIQFSRTQKRIATLTPNSSDVQLNGAKA